jgi:hypothetical protein
VATWGGNPGVFTVERNGNPTPQLLVWYAIGGTASNGVDYQAISHWVEIPSGVRFSDIIIWPTNMMANPVNFTKTVILTLTNSPLLIPVNYSIGSPSSATVTIFPGPDTNNPPLVDIPYPTDGEKFWTPVNIPIVAVARDVDGSISNVEFFADGVSLGIVTNPVTILPAMSGEPALPQMPPYGPFVLVWSNAPPTNHILTAKATDTGGASTVSDPVNITVLPGPPPTTPIVRITSPPSGSVFHQPINLPIFAFAADLGGMVTNVQFFAGTNNLGAGHPVAAVTAGAIQPLYWGLVWSNAPVVTNVPLTAVATDNRGLSAISDAVKVTILPPIVPPTPTNVVAIFATDPIAIEGTNCWPWIGLAACAPTWANWATPNTICRYFTNCGPNDAEFTVRRLGPTNSDLSVTYAIGGTATNGVDYVTLPGSVTIAAGAREAMITVLPIDDGPPDITSTVVLKLTPSPEYVVDPRHSTAAAIILDGRTPPPVATGLLPDGCFHLSATGPEGAYVRFEYTTDLRTWTPICTNQVFRGWSDLIDPDAPNNQVRFYRAVHDADPPQ